MKPAVSVIIPAWNAERWIGDALSSAAGQSWTDLELIVVNDGSTDSTSETVTAFADPRIRLIEQEHRGAAAARNRGLAESRGAFVQFLDADDMLSDDKIGRQISALSSAPPGCVASCAWARFTDAPETALVDVEEVWSVTDPIEWLIKSLSGGGMMQPGAWLTPRDIVERAGPWNETLTLHDDGEFFSRVLLGAHLNVFVDGAVAYYRDVEQSLSRRRSRAAIESALEVCRLRESHLIAVRDDVAVRRALATQYAQFAYEFAGTAPDLASEAARAITALRAKPAMAIGGPLFRISTSLFGLSAALRLRSVA